MKTVNIDVTVDAPMPEAQGRILDRVDRQLRSVGFTGRPWTARWCTGRNLSAFPWSGWSAVSRMNTWPSPSPSRDRLPMCGRPGGSAGAHTEVTEALGGR
jgi:hypothetical protein